MVQAPTEPTLLQQISAESHRRKGNEIVQTLADIKTLTGFTPHGDDLLPQFDRIPFFKRLGDLFEVYFDKHVRSQTKDNGKPESAEYGIGKFGKQQAVIYAMNYDFMGGSLAVVAIEKLYEATEVAARLNLPLVTVYSSGGARQDENIDALYGMEMVVDAVRTLQEKRPNLPVISVLLGEVWGGVTASSMPQANLIIGFDGTGVGFAGDKVISAHEGKKIDPSAQSVEAQHQYRKVDMIVNDPEEFYNTVTDFLTYNKQAKLPEAGITTKLLVNLALFNFFRHFRRSLVLVKVLT
jgi:acetyl-CoA carboxylase carboxyl transferase subunit beta